jgi:predicted nuclease of predicted toxin-antitoxin system
VRFKIDENLPVEAAVMLAVAGHDALTIRDQHLVGEPDPRVAAVCHSEQRALVTLDLDFADVRTYPPGDFAGIIVLRPRTQAKRVVLSLLQQLVKLLSAEPLHGNLWILQETGLRIREGERGDHANP